MHLTPSTTSKYSTAVRARSDEFYLLLYSNSVRSLELFTLRNSAFSLYVKGRKIHFFSLPF